MSKVLTSMLYIHPLGCDVYRLAWAIVCYKWVGSPEPQRGNYNSSHATFFVYILVLGTGRGVNIIHMTEPSKDLKKIEGAAPNGVAVVNCNDFVIRR